MYNGNQLRDAIISAANHISNNRKQVDDLNVFPVPDGDTGTNMSMTVNNAARELVSINNASAGSVAATTASAMLRGARGNSGVITSLLFRGFAKGFKDQENVTGENLSEALKQGVEAAYKAVMKPTEGTILTVARVASEYAATAVEKGETDALKVFEAAMEGAKTALAQTPELLPVLKKAGVVDAGGRGFVVILEGMYSVFKDGVVIEGGVSADSAEEEEESGALSAAAEFEGDITFPYCTEFIVRRDKEDAGEPSELRAYLESIGDCVVVVDDEEIIKVHVHTDHPGNAIEKGITFGSLVNMKIENMCDQHERAKHDDKSKQKKPAQSADRTETFTPVAPTKPVGFVSVCAGDGLAELFRELGADTIVSGGQTMNPSTDDILKAIEATPAETVFVLPNNKNIIMAAEQAIPISTRKVIVVHTKTIPQGITAMISYMPGESAEANEAQMTESLSTVVSGSVTYAVRDTRMGEFEIKADNILALKNDEICQVGQDLIKTTKQLLESMVSDETSLVTIYYGEDATEEEAVELKEHVEEFCPGVGVEIQSGGQPLYYYLLSAE